MKRAALDGAGAGYDDCATVSGAGDGARAQDGGNRKESGYADVYRPAALPGALVTMATLGLSRLDGFETSHGACARCGARGRVIRARQEAADVR
jgi:hypothetical protein